MPSREDLVQRRAELDRILATALPDQRTPISQLLSGQQPLDPIQTQLEDMQAHQRSRQHSILEHWPLIVEAAEIDQTLTGQGGTDTDFPGRRAHLNLGGEL